MKKLLFLLNLLIWTAVNVSSQSFSSYIIQFRDDEGKKMAVNSFLGVSDTKNISLASKEASGNLDEWVFIPVGKNEPGWYFIKNVKYKMYLKSGIEEKAVISLTNTIGSKDTKWQLLKIDVPQKVLPESGRFFKLISQNGGMLYLDNEVLYTTMIEPKRKYSTVKIFSANLENPEKSLKTIVFNKDLELISNYLPFQIPDDVNSVGQLLIPTTNQLDFSPIPHKAATDFFPVGYTRSTVDGVRLMYSNYSSGNSETSGYYFVRLDNGESLQLDVVNPASSPTTVFVVSYWARIITQSGSAPENIPFILKKDKSLSNIKSIGQLTAGSRAEYNSDPTPMTPENYTKDPDDPNAWAYYSFEYINIDGLRKDLFVSIDNMMPKNGEKVFIDIDNFQITVKDDFDHQTSLQKGGKDKVSANSFLGLSCPVCGKTVDINGKCPNCNYDFNKENQAESSVFSTVKDTVWILFCVGLIVMVVILITRILKKTI